MNQWMLIFSLGPVQSFIERARKTRDLWFGSFLLAKLMEAAMNGIDDLTLQFVFPTFRKVDEQSANLPNKYIALFASSGLAKQAAEQSTEQLKAYWRRLCQDVWNEIVRDYATPETDTIWQRQSDPDHWFEIRWVIVEGNPSEYKRWLDDAETAFTARKHIHNFLQQEEPGEKSTVSGERQALHGVLWENEPERKQAQVFWRTLVTRKGHPRKGSLSAKDISLDGSERLDAIDTIKRFASASKDIPRHPFPSTSSIATASFVEGLLFVDPSHLQAWRYATRKPLVDMPIEATRAIPYLKHNVGEDYWLLRRDGDCYFPETFTPHRLEKDYGILQKDEASRRATEGKQGLVQLLKAADNKGLRRPTPYYAAVKMDGDHMRELLGSVNSQNEHIALSRALSDFTGNVAPSFFHKEYPGRLVYAGGDDVLALAPLARNLLPEANKQPDIINTVLELANQLQRRYRQCIQPSVAESVWPRVTASIGIALAHSSTPLSLVLRTMREAERVYAKQYYGRNALAVTVIRRSGAQTRVGCRWEYNVLTRESLPQPLVIFSQFYQLFEQDILSPVCAHILLEEAPTLVWLDRDAQQSEIKRVLQRQRNDKRGSDLLDDTIHNLALYLRWLAEAMDREHPDLDEAKSVELETEGPRYGLIEVLGWLLVISFLARKEED